jgi:hypothetical protein
MHPVMLGGPVSMPHGHGTLTYASGTKYVGEWKDGLEWEGKEYDKDGKVVATYSEWVRNAGN